VVCSIGLIPSHTNVVQEIHECPRCKSSVCGNILASKIIVVPFDCPICDLRLVSGPLLARSYHLLFPMSDFILTEVQECYACMAVDGTDYYKHQKCGKVFCGDCKRFLIEDLHNCPGCL
jgi:transcription initiation factor TFIIH subunit 2